MKISTHTAQKIKSKSKGFSLVEVIIALGIVALLLTGFLGVFGTAQKNIQRALSVKEANMLRDSLEVELKTLRIGEKYNNSFHKAFEMIKKSRDKQAAIIIYQYKAEFPKANSNVDILPHYTDKNGIPGKDYLTQAAVRLKGDSKLIGNEVIKKELSAVSSVGSVYVVKITQLVKDKNTGSLITVNNDPEKLTTLDAAGNHKSVESYNDFYEAVIVFQAEFFRLPTSAPTYVTGDKWEFNKLGAPVATINLAVRR